MSSTAVIIESSSTTNDQLTLNDEKLGEFDSIYETHSSTSNVSRSSSFSVRNPSPLSSSFGSSNEYNSDLSMNKINSSSILSSNHRKETTLKLPYPVLSDHREPSSILVLLQNETQTTSKKILDVVKQIEQCEQRLTLNIYTDNEKKSFKYERVKLKQQLDRLKKHERRVNLQIDFITTKTEIKGLEDEKKQFNDNQESDESQQIKILLQKLKQKLDRMKIYMRTRNEQMKKISSGKQCLTTSNDNHKSSLSSSQRQRHVYSSAAKDLNRKHSSTSTNNSHSNKRLKSTIPIVRLTSRVTSHESKNCATQPPTVRFINKTTHPTVTTGNSASPTTPASILSTLSSPLIRHTNIRDSQLHGNSPQQIEILTGNDDNDELDLELDVDELFNDDSCSEQPM